MTSKQKIHQANLSKWAAIFREQAESGLTIKEWCARNDVSFHKYNYWKHQAKESYIDSILPDIVPISMPPEPVSESLPVSLVSRDSCNSLDSVIISIGDIRIEIGSSASDDMIAGIVKAVRHA